MAITRGQDSLPSKGTVAARSGGDASLRKRKLRFDVTATTTKTTPEESPAKWKSPRGLTDPSPRSHGSSCEDSRTKPASPSKVVVANKLFESCNKLDWNPTDNEQINTVKKALHVSEAPPTIVCREDEQKRVLDFVKDCVTEQKGGSLYICGCPGTGKSLLMDKVKQQMVGWTKDSDLQSPDILALNCTLLTGTSEIFSKILGQNQSKKKQNCSPSPLKQLQTLYSPRQKASRSKMMLLIVDEMDYLITRDRQVLHDLFMLTTLPFSRCILIGIANAIDLADRFLPKLKSMNCTPVVITFRAYSVHQILKILQERLLALPYIVFQPQALELCARKVAAASGDMRKALRVCWSAVEILEGELKDLTSDPSSKLDEGESFSQHTAPATNMVRIDHMAVALSKTFKSPVVDTIQSLPQHQQIVVCAAVKAFRGGKKDATVVELSKSYTEICKSSMVPPQGISEFVDMCKVLSDQCLLKLGPGRQDKLKRVTLNADESDITFALQGIRFFRNCLQ